MKKSRTKQLDPELQAAWADEWPKELREEKKRIIPKQAEGPFITIVRLVLGLSLLYCVIGSVISCYADDKGLIGLAAFFIVVMALGPGSDKR